MRLFFAQVQLISNTNIFCKSSEARIGKNNLKNHSFISLVRNNIRNHIHALSDSDHLKPRRQIYLFSFQATHHLVSL